MEYIYEGISSRVINLSKKTTQSVNVEEVYEFPENKENVIFVWWNTGLGFVKQQK